MSDMPFVSKGIGCLANKPLGLLLIDRMRGLFKGVAEKL